MSLVTTTSAVPEPREETQPVVPRTRLGDGPLLDLFQADSQPLETPAAQNALQLGILQAKQEAMRRTESLTRWGTPLVVGIVTVSFVHLWDTIAAIRPEFTDMLELPTWLYHTTAAALTLAIDAAALYCASAAGVVQMFLPKEVRRGSASLSFFLLTTFLLNAAFIVRYAPSLPADIRGNILPVLELLFVILLPAIVPVGILAIEGSASQLAAIRLRLLVETTALEELLKPSVKKPHNVSGSIVEETEGERKALREDSDSGGIARGRSHMFTLEDLRRAADAGGIIRRAILLEKLGCSETTVDRLLAEGMETGAIRRVARGEYVLV